jgi:hypothetical protein
VPIDYFIARYDEIQRLERALSQASRGRNENIFVSGPRGIGKSSLAGFMRHLAEKEYGFIAVHSFLGGVNTLEEMIRVIFQRLFRECADKSIFDKLRRLFENFISEVKLFGISVEFTKDKTKLSSLVDNFLPVLCKIYSEIKEENKKGLLLILDDLNGITDLPAFSQFLKSFIDELATSKKSIPLVLVLVGIPERRGDLIKHQPSVGRIFDIVELSLMSKSESEEFFKHIFEKQNMTVSSESLSMMVQLSGGYPMLMHEVGDAVFWQDSDNHIDEKDARTGIMEAARIIGKKYIDPQISKVLKSRTYASILWKIGKKLPLGSEIKRKEILKNMPDSEQGNLDNFLARIKKLGIIKEAETRGEYQFVNPLYHLYIWYESKNQNE